MASPKPVGRPTRGTTNPNRLRRVDRYLSGPLAPVLRHVARPTVVDLGFGASAWTTLELRRRLEAVVPGVRVVGVEIDPDRVTAALPHSDESLAFLHGGFEVPVPEGWARPALVKAMNVLRQYDEGEVGQAWARIVARLAPGGALVDGTCDEIGRLGAWVVVTAAGPQTLTLSVAVEHLGRPSDVAARLPKCLIHHNAPGERVHELLRALDRAWDTAAPLSAYGARQRWLATVGRLRADGWPVLAGPQRWRLGEVTVPWGSAAPASAGI